MPVPVRRVEGWSAGLCLFERRRRCAPQPETSEVSRGEVARSVDVVVEAVDPLQLPYGLQLAFAVRAGAGLTLVAGHRVEGVQDDALEQLTQGLVVELGETIDDLDQAPYESPGRPFSSRPTAIAAADPMAALVPSGPVTTPISLRTRPMSPPLSAATSTVGPKPEAMRCRVSCWPINVRTRAHTAGVDASSDQTDVSRRAMSSAVV